MFVVFMVQDLGKQWCQNQFFTEKTNSSTFVCFGAIWLIILVILVLTKQISWMCVKNETFCFLLLHVLLSLSPHSKGKFAIDPQSSPLLALMLGVCGMAKRCQRACCLTCNTHTHPQSQSKHV